MPEGTETVEKKVEPPAARANKMLDRLIERHGSAEAALAVVVAQNLSYSDQSDAHAVAIADLKKQIPATDAVVLTGERAKAFNAFEALKLTPEQVTETQKERDTLKGTLGDRDREALARSAALSAGFDPDAMVDLARSKGLHIELKDGTVKENGKEIHRKIPHVRPAADEKAALVPLSEYAGTLAAHEQRSLKAQPGQMQMHTGTEWPSQETTPAGGKSTSDPVAAFITKRNDTAGKRPNPLFPSRQAEPAGKP